MENPWKEHSAIHPEVSNGHRRIETTILRALIGHGLRGSELATALAVIDKTYGHQKTWDFISYGQLAKITKSNRRTTRRAINSLECQHILVVDRSAGPRRKMRLMFNKYHDTWCKNQGTLRDPSEDQLRVQRPPELGPQGPPDGDDQLRVQGPPAGTTQTPRSEGPQTPHNRKKKLIKNKTSCPNSESDPADFPPEVEALANRFRRKILQWKPDWKPPTEKAFHNWKVTIDRMIRLDNRTPKRIAQVIHFATNDSFWQPNIMSANKLREKFDTLEGQMRRRTSSSNASREKTRRERQAIANWLKSKKGDQQPTEEKDDG